MLIVMTQMNTDILVDNLRNPLNQREIIFHADDADDADYLDENQRDNSVVVEKGLFPVYRLEEDVGLLQEGAVRLTVRTIRAGSYKIEAEGRHQGNAPSSSRGGCRFLLIVMTQMNTDLLVDNQRNQRNLRENSFCLSVET